MDFFCALINYGEHVATFFSVIGNPICIVAVFCVSYLVALIAYNFFFNFFKVLLQYHDFLGYVSCIGDTGVFVKCSTTFRQHNVNSLFIRWQSLFNRLTCLLTKNKIVTSFTISGSKWPGKNTDKKKKSNYQ